MAMQQEALEAIRKANNPGGKPSVYTLRGRNEALGPTKDLAHEGFGTYEDKFSENPLIGDLPTKNVLRDEQMQYILPNRTSTRRILLTKKLLALGAEFDVTNEVLNDKIPLHEIEAVHYLHSDESVMEIETKRDGYNSGRVYHLRPPASSLHSWLEAIRDATEKARDHKNSNFRRFRKWCTRAYKMSIIQNIVALLIIGNFIAIAAEAQEQPTEKDSLFQLMRKLDLAFTLLFTAEIILNAFAHWFWPFVKNWWNILDIIVVGCSLITLAQIPALDVLQPMRAFRIFRLAGKVQQLRRIVDAVSTSVIPMANAFFIGVVMTAIFSILGTELYKARDAKHFGTFSRTFNTLWLVIAFQEWSADMPIFRDDGTIDFGVLGFLLALVFVLVWIMLQVVVATLLDHFVSATNKAFQSESMKKLDNAGSTNIDTGGIEPLLVELIQLFDTSDQISRGFKKIFHKLDYDRTGRIDYVKMKEGLKKLNTKVEINLSPEDFDILVENGKMCFEDRTINVAQWDRIMRKQMKMHVQRDLTDVMAMHDEMIEMKTLLSSHRILHLNDPTEYVNKIEEEKEVFTRDMHLFKKKLETDIGLLVGLLSTLIKKTSMSISDRSSRVPIVAELNSWESEELLERAQIQDEEIRNLKELVVMLQESVDHNTKAVTAASTSRNTPYTGKSSPISHHGNASHNGIAADLMEAADMLKPEPRRGRFAEERAPVNGYELVEAPRIPTRGLASFGSPAQPPSEFGSQASPPRDPAPRRSFGIVVAPRSNGNDGAGSGFSAIMPKLTSKVRPSRSETVAATSMGVTASAPTGILGFPSENNSDREVH